MLQDKIKFLQMELKTKNKTINNLLDTQSAIVKSLSLAKQQNNQEASLAKQQTKVQGKSELYRPELAQLKPETAPAKQTSSKTPLC